MENGSKNNDVIILELDKAREIKFGVKAIKIIEKLKKCKISNLNLDDLSTDELVQIVHAGLIEKEGLTIDDLETLIDRHTTIGELMLKISEAFQVAFGKNALTPEQQALMDSMIESNKSKS